MKRIFFSLFVLLISFKNLSSSDKAISVIKIKNKKKFLENIILSAASMRFLSSLECFARSKIIDIDFIEASKPKRVVNSPFDNSTNRKKDFYLIRMPVIEVARYEVEDTKQIYERETYMPFFVDEVDAKKINLVELRKKRLVAESIRLQKARDCYEEILKKTKESAAIEKRDSIESNKKLQPIGNTRGANWENGVDKLLAARLLEETKERTEKEIKNSVESQKS